MKILLTGHRGYLGSNFTETHGAVGEIVGYDLADGDDLANYEGLVSRADGCEMAVHLAAIPGPVEGKSIDDYFTVKVQGTLNVLKAAVAAGLRRVVGASSVTVYGIENGIPSRRQFERASRSCLNI